MNDTNTQLPMITWFSLSLQTLRLKISKTNDKFNIPLNYEVVKFAGQDLLCFLSH